MQGFLVLVLIFAIVVAMFAIQNTALVAVHFLFWQTELSLVLVILGGVALGALMLFFLGLVRQLADRRARKELSRKNERLEKDGEDNAKILAEKDRVIGELEARLAEALKPAAGGDDERAETGRAGAGVVGAGVAGAGSFGIPAVENSLSPGGD